MTYALTLRWIESNRIQYADTTAIDGWMDQKMTYTHTSGMVQYNTPLGLLFDDGISRMDRSCCAADELDSIHRTEQSKDDTCRMCMIRQTNPMGVQYYSTPLGFVSRINSIQFNSIGWMHSLMKDRSEDEISHRPTEPNGSYL
jgi:hypothetical protein